MTIKKTIFHKAGKKSGKTAIIMAGVHGNEKTGIAAFKILIDKVKPKRGEVYFIFVNS